MGELLSRTLRETRLDGGQRGAIPLPADGHVTIPTRALWSSRHPRFHGNDEYDSKLALGCLAPLGGGFA